MPAKKPRCCACNAAVDAVLSLQCNSGHWCCRDCTRNIITIRLGRCEDDITGVPCCLNTCAERYDADEVIPFLTKEHLHSIRCIERQKAKSEAEKSHSRSMASIITEAQALTALTFITCCLGMGTPTMGALCWYAAYGRKSKPSSTPGGQCSLPDAKRYFWGLKAYDGNPVVEYWFKAWTVVLFLIVLPIAALAWFLNRRFWSAWSLDEVPSYLWREDLRQVLLALGLSCLPAVGFAELLYRYPWLRLAWAFSGGMFSVGTVPTMAVFGPLWMHCIRYVFGFWRRHDPTPAYVSFATETS